MKSSISIQYQYQVTYEVTEVTWHYLTDNLMWTNHIKLVQYCTVFNYNLDIKHVPEFTHFQQCQHKLNIVSFLKTDIVAWLLY